MEASLNGVMICMVISILSQCGSLNSQAERILRRDLAYC